MPSDAADKQTDTPALAPGWLKRHRRWLIPALVMMLMFVVLLSPGRVNRVVPPPAPGESVAVGLVHGSDGNTWLLLPRPGGGAVMYRFGLMHPDAGPLDLTYATLAGTEAGLYRRDLSDPRPLQQIALTLNAQSVQTFQAPQGSVFGLVRRLDEEFDGSIGTVTAGPDAGTLRVMQPNGVYRPLRTNGARWLAQRLTDLGAQVEGTATFDQWEVESSAP